MLPPNRAAGQNGGVQEALGGSRWRGAAGVTALASNFLSSYNGGPANDAGATGRGGPSATEALFSTAHAKTSSVRQSAVLTWNEHSMRHPGTLLQYERGSQRLGSGILESPSRRRSESVGSRDSKGGSQRMRRPDDSGRRLTRKPKKKKKKQGTFMGVYIPVVASMWGVLIFIRFGVIVAYAGWAMSVGFVILAAAAQILTTLSLCTVLSNSSNYSGGSFGILKRNLGSDMAGVICLLYYFGMTTMASVELLGAVQAIDYILAGTDSYEGISITSSQYIDQFAIGVPVLFLLAFIRTTKLHVVHVMATVILVGVIMTFLLGFLGIFLTPTGWTGAVGDVPGFTGLNLDTFLANARPDFSLPSQDEDVLYNDFGVTRTMVEENSTRDPAAALSIIFPMFLGIFQGANKAADLETPNKSIIRGTGFAILTSFAVYITFFLLLAAVAQRELLKVDFLLFDRLAWPTQYIALIATVAVGIGACVELLEIGPTILQAVAADGLFSFLPRLGLHKVNSKGQPVRAIAMVSVPINFFLLFTPSAYFEDLATVVTMFFLQAYGHMHLSLLLNEVQRHSSWRPTFVYYHWSTAALGLITTVVLMFYISWIQAVVTLSLATALLIIARVVEEPRRKGLGTRALAQGRALDHILADHFVDHREIIERLRRTLETVGKNMGQELSTDAVLRAVHEETALVPDEPPHWDPQVLCMVEDPDNPGLREDHVKMVHLTNQLTGSGVLPRLAVVASTIRASKDDDLNKLDRLRQLKELRLYALITATNARAFAHVTVVPNDCPSSAAYMIMMQSVGLGNLKPNMILLNWTNPRLLDVVKNSMLAKRIVVVLKDRRPLGFSKSAAQPAQNRRARANRSRKSGGSGSFGNTVQQFMQQNQQMKEQEQVLQNPKQNPKQIPVPNPASTTSVGAAQRGRTRSGSNTIDVTAAVAVASVMATSNPHETSPAPGKNNEDPNAVPDVIRAPYRGSDVKYSFAFSESNIFGSESALPPQFGPGPDRPRREGKRQDLQQHLQQPASSASGSASTGIPDDRSAANDSEDDELDYEELDEEEFDQAQDDIMHMESQAEAELHYHNKWKRRRGARLKQRVGTIDVWWFLKNGGLPVVIARLLLTHRVWRRCHIRVFATVEGSEISDWHTMQHALEVEHMLHTMRVKASVEVIQIDPYTQHVIRETILDEDEELVADMPTVAPSVRERSESTRPTLQSLFKLSAMSEGDENENDGDDDNDNNTDGKKPKDKKEENAEALRARAVASFGNLMFEHSKDAQLVICNLPMPTEETSESYIDFMDRLSYNLERVLFVHTPFDDAEIAERFVH
ncbi:Solute carrier family 12 member 9 [Hondaea fermentalgiana]|uniref:Solute carrier family 12 member 9 n=1 Tax=Hondaea fermentalgiana TaxID=2315210 RepID=A0A2R5GYK1_9STRA|nr:Solute carrier family 12 member 9 [Hondaea fermentalgiana]|eukprot:GBG33541.1 Solute carrier family 12 member 9 [Hondaea fermentalgiana]